MLSMEDIVSIFKPKVNFLDAKRQMEEIWAQFLLENTDSGIRIGQSIIRQVATKQKSISSTSPISWFRSKVVMALSTSDSASTMAIGREAPTITKEVLTKDNLMVELLVCP